MKRLTSAVAIVGVTALASAYAIGRIGGYPDPVIAPQGPPAARPADATLDITYIANEGVLVAAGTSQVLIDGLHRQYRASYPFLPDPYREQIETARPPFQDVDLILVSHAHRDHFHPESVARHLRHNTGAVLVSSGQVVEELEGIEGYTDIKSRVTAVTPALKQRVTMDAKGIRLEVLGVGHGTGRHATVQNLGHVITLSGKRVLHIGDASTEDAAIFDAFDLDQAKIDIAFLPVWFLTSDEGAAIVREHIKPRHIIAVHMPADDAQGAAAQIKKRFPDAVPFTVLLEKKFY